MIIRNLSRNELVTWMQLSKAVGEITFYSLLKLHKTTENALMEISNLQKRTNKKIKLPTKTVILKEIETVENFGATVIASCEKKYSPKLRRVRDAPPIVTAKGNIELLTKPSVAIVGSRNATINSCNFAYSIAVELAKEGFSIVSGLATGIDTAAHRIIDKNLPTIAVIGTGIDRYYPVENQRLQDSIISNGGLVITEVPFGDRGHSVHFARRNRIISGLAECIVIIEASDNAGSLLSAQYALAQGRSVFAAPGSPMDKRFAGSNRLIKNGATLIESADDILNTLRNRSKTYDYPTLSEVEQEFIHLTNSKEDMEQMEYAKTQILEKLEQTPVPMHTLMHELKLDERTLLKAITELEIEKKISRSISDEVSILYE